MKRYFAVIESGIGTPRREITAYEAGEWQPDLKEGGAPGPRLTDKIQRGENYFTPGKVAVGSCCPFSRDPGSQTVNCNKGNSPLIAKHIN